jgi:hypothetical protein
MHIFPIKMENLSRDFFPKSKVKKLIIILLEGFERFVVFISR